MPRTRRPYAEEFRREAVELVCQGRSVADVGSDGPVAKAHAPLVADARVARVAVPASAGSHENPAAM